MTRLFLGLGSNIEPARYLPLGLSKLEALLGKMRVSPVYEGAAIGFSGAPFWNLVIEAQTSLSVGELQSALRVIEYAHGRAKDASRFSPRSLDIDILLYGDVCGVVDGVVLPRGEILENAFVLRPLAELAPDAIHPGVHKSFSELWGDYDADSQPLTPVSLDGS
ncbi:2-amino-4-hydroxy-6-hydroxymethyldihydropteridine diphosphokinase [Congregibacter variabilis]|uniref:2-amino-4-hydroxy-6-hydroxymethyldihydropteridine diphosphokinase n=1 Tax=Congregibacter variabilis TaxID=3081200 RepID=A0ABZ0I4C5_9GAMM|nr:2-amino-4-hydroxy-6-hydroxymethyldihydropteridine diphosphokinase [Congregibacter sp. IMCC43200]